MWYFLFESLFNFEIYPCSPTYWQRPAPSSHWGCWLNRLVEMRYPRMHRCVARTVAMLNPWLEVSVNVGLTDFLGEASCKRFSRITVPWLHSQALHHMKPQMERSDGVRSGFRFPMNVGWPQLCQLCNCIPVTGCGFQTSAAMMQLFQRLSLPLLQHLWVVLQYEFPVVTMVFVL